MKYKINIFFNESGDNFQSLIEELTYLYFKKIIYNVRKYL